MDMNLSKQEIEEFEYELKQRLLEDEIEMRRMIEEESLDCNKCKRTLDMGEFYPHKQSTRGYSYACKNCMAERYLATKTGGRKRKWKSKKSSESGSAFHISGPVVYEFSIAGEIVYIGLTTNFYARMTRHRSKSDFFCSIDRVRYHCAKSEIDMAVIEAVLINRHRPIFNTKIMDGPCSFTIPYEIEWLELFTNNSLTTSVILGDMKIKEKEKRKSRVNDNT